MNPNQKSKPKLSTSYRFYSKIASWPVRYAMNMVAAKMLAAEMVQQLQSVVAKAQ